MLGSKEISYEFQRAVVSVSPFGNDRIVLESGEGSPRPGCIAKSGVGLIQPV